MRNPCSPTFWRSVAITVCLCLAGLAGPSGAALAASGPDQDLTNKKCLVCHDGKKHKLELALPDGEKRALVAVNREQFARGLHAKMDCVACHTNITDNKSPHVKTSPAAKVDCVQCHTELWTAAQQAGTAATKPGLGLVMQNAAAYKQSFHARPNADDPARPNASCHECHDSHSFNVPPRDTPEHALWRLSTPALCGSACHQEQLEEYAASVHGKAVLEMKDARSAVCIDCHSSHAIGGTSASPVRLAITEQCGSCHEDSLKTYRATYHGKVGALGYAYTAKCFDCHGSHDIVKSDNPESPLHVDNRLKVCQKCHNDTEPGMRTATAGFVSFGPHAHSHDFQKYPQMWIVTKFMIALLIGVFAFFWLHSGLWYYREWKELREGKIISYVRTGDLALDETKFFQRFPLGWRIAHLCFALITMTLVLTGTTALFAEGPWAPAVARFFGGPHALGLIHRVAASLFVGIFFIHFVYVMQKLLRDKNFLWFGPDSLIPNLKDLRDCYGMFLWFFGKGPKPLFDRWTYFEKFDYWAVFWGVSIIGTSGLMLAFPHITASYFPGWIFNVATVVHGEEAFLAAVFLFTVHFFNNHFRPDKMPPPDIVMFTGAQSLEEFRRDHPAQYRRLMDSGELKNYLVDAPGKPMTIASKLLGVILILVGLTLLALVSIGFFSGL